MGPAPHGGGRPGRRVTHGASERSTPGRPRSWCRLVQAFRESFPHTVVEMVNSQQAEIHEGLVEVPLDLGLDNVLSGDDVPPDLSRHRASPRARGRLLPTRQPPGGEGRAHRATCAAIPSSRCGPAARFTASCTRLFGSASPGVGLHRQRGDRQAPGGRGLRYTIATPTTASQEARNSMSTIVTATAGRGPDVGDPAVPPQGRTRSPDRPPAALGLVAGARLQGPRVVSDPEPSSLSRTRAGSAARCCRG